MGSTIVFWLILTLAQIGLKVALLVCKLSDVGPQIRASEHLIILGSHRWPYINDLHIISNIHLDSGHAVAQICLIMHLVPP